MATTVAPVEVTLGRRQLYMLPTRYGLLFALVATVLLLASINYGNGLGYALTFLLVAIAVVSMLHTHRNLHRLRVAPGACVPVFAGETAQFELVLTNNADTPRFGVVIEQNGAEVARADIAARATAAVMLGQRVTRRGWQTLPAFRLATHFPLGLLYSWSRPVHIDHRCLVYPAPAAPLPFRTTPTETLRPEQGQRLGGDDFIGVREYQPGDSPRHIDWKAFARTGMLTTKQFGGGYQALVWLDWDALPEFDTEARLSVLARWVLEGEAAGAHYGLRLPGIVIAPDHGEAHEHVCLKALALFELRP
ncbi:MAG: DUF58 domain-containing protein [Gammaproteobacteria bacterium]|nr:MAG: DUF58 domain-containing protein [Gammaproteobacteria bacterium]